MYKSVIINTWSSLHIFPFICSLPHHYTHTHTNTAFCFLHWPEAPPYYNSLIHTIKSQLLISLLWFCVFRRLVSFSLFFDLVFPTAQELDSLACAQWLVCRPRANVETLSVSVWRCSVDRGGQLWFSHFSHMNVHELFMLWFKVLRDCVWKKTDIIIL